MKWGDPKTYAWLYRVSGAQYRNQLLFWLQYENAQLHKLVLKEIGLEANSQASRSGKRKKDSAMALGSSGADEDLGLEAGVSEMGQDLLAGGA